MSSNFKYAVMKSVKPYGKFVPQLSKPVLRILIQVSVHYIESKNKKCSPEVLDMALKKLTHSGCEIPKNFCELFAAILLIMQNFLRTPKGSVKDQELRECLRELKFTEDCIDDLSKVLHNHRESLTKNFCEAKCLRSPPKKIQWRLNVSLGESGLTKFKQQPTIILHFQVKDGEFRTLELPLAMFHKIRYNIALLLHEMQTLEKKLALKKYSS
ncbi:COMMD5 family protein [Megaselia abdita]